MDIGTVVAWLQVVFWLFSGIAWGRKMINDKKLELPNLPMSTKALGIAVAAGLLVSVVSLYYNYRPRVVEKTVVQYLEKPTLNVVTAWGNADIGACRESVNGAALTEYAEKYDVVIICGVVDSRVDKFSDHAISVSSSYSIHDSIIEILFDTSDSMKAAAKKLTDEQLKGLPQPPKKGTAVGITIPIWYEVTVMPKGSDLTNIKQLSDVPRYGGIVLSQRSNLGGSSS